jgi:hypothetical protein
MPWVWVQSTMGIGVDIPWVGADIPWLGVDIPWVWGRHTMGNGSKHHG